MAIRNLAVLWLSGGALLLGYAAFAWLRSKRRGAPAAAESGRLDREDVEPLSQRLERVPEELVLDFDTLDRDPEYEHPPQSRVIAPRSALGDLFLARATEALSPRGFHVVDELAHRRSSAR